MSEQLQRRGPDGKGEWLSQDQRLVLVHRRLSIIDTSEAGAQPMVSSCGRYTVVYNGEIYNYRALRDQLRGLGHQFYTQSDTEVLLAAFAQWGAGMLERLRGMYALAIWDADNGILFLARDPFGIKPLYVADDGWSIRFASTISALRRCSGVGDASEPAGRVGFFLFGSIPEPFTPWQAIKSLPAGHYQWVTETGPQAPVAHFRLPSLFDTSADLIDTRTALLDTVSAHLEADVPVASFLSAGVDSGCLLGLMSEINSHPVKATTICFEGMGGDADESAGAAQVAKLYGADHRIDRVTESEFRRCMPTILEDMDSPSIDGVNTWLVSRACARRGAKVAISGLGGDEICGTYPSFSLVPRIVRWGRWPAAIPGVGRLSRVVLAPLMERFDLPTKAASVIVSAGSAGSAYRLVRGLFGPEELEQLLPRDEVHEGLHRLKLDQLLNNTGYSVAKSWFAKVSVLEQGWYMKNQLLRDTDWASMAHSLEVRVPLVDPTFQRAFLKSGLLTKNRMANAPAVPLPSSIQNRTKTGFTTPINRWLVADCAKNEHWSRAWARKVWAT